MIVKGNQRSGGQNLASHLLKDENDHIELFELRGFMADDLHGAFAEAQAIAKGTKCKQYLFSLSLNPPPDQAASTESFIKAADEAEKRLGLTGQPRAIVFHEKQGPNGYRRHAHVVWSRIDSESMTAVNHSWYKNKLTSLSKELYLEHGWELPGGLKDPMLKNPLNFTHAEWQQALRTDRDPREIKQAFRQAWERSDSPKAFRAALQEQGFMLAKGDRRGFVAVDYQGEVYSLARWTGIKAKEVKQRLGSPDGFPSVDQAKRRFRKAITPRLKQMMEDLKQQQAKELAPLLKAKQDMVKEHARQRRELKARQEKRWQQEAKIRQARLHTGLKGLWDWVSGRAKQVREHNQRTAWLAHKRDQRERDSLLLKHLSDQEKIQQRLQELKKCQSDNHYSLTNNFRKILLIDEYKMLRRTRLLKIKGCSAKQSPSSIER